MPNNPLLLTSHFSPLWQEAMGIAERIFCLTDNLPKKEDYGFTSQIRRAAPSISANTAEAFGRNHKMDKINFYYIARGSVTETQSHLSMEEERSISTMPLPKSSMKSSTNFITTSISL